MEPNEIRELRQAMEERIAELARMQRHLKRPSTLSFVERREFAGKAGRSTETLRERAAALDAAGEEPSEETVQASREALDEAEALLARWDAAQPASLVRRRESRHRMPGEHRRGAAAGATGVERAAPASSPPASAAPETPDEATASGE